MSEQQSRSRRVKGALIALLWALAVVAPLGYSLWVSVASPVVYRVSGFRFRGPASLGAAPVWRQAGPEAVGRENPTFIVGPLKDEGIDCVLRREHSAVTVSGRAALLQEHEAFAPGHGGRDHSLLVYVPELEAGISVCYRTHERDHGSGLAESLDAWRCRRWARTILASLEWAPGD